MKRIIVYLFAIFACVFLTATVAQAQATRTWVSGVGDDVNPCSRTAPCKTFAGAISKTAAGGEIDALDPGGFGTVTITKAITIDGGGGQVASVLASGTNGFNINAGVSDTVILRNLRISGAGVTLGVIGINYIAGGQLVVDNCTIEKFSSNGIKAVLTASGNLVVTHTKIIRADTSAIVLNTTAGTVFGSISHVDIQDSGNGIVMKAGGIADISDSTLSGIGGTSLFVQAGVLTASRNLISNGGTAVLAQGGVVRLTANTIYNNATDISSAGGSIGTTGNNTLAGNGGSSVSPTFTTY